MRTRVAVVAGLVTVLAVVGACAGEPEAPGEPGPTPSTPASTPTAAPESPSLVPVTPGRSAAGQIITGRVVSGVEQGCVLLETDGEDYLLIGDVAADVPIGQTATVRGRVRDDLASICQQGIPFEVTEVLD